MKRSKHAELLLELQLGQAEYLAKRVIERAAEVIDQSKRYGYRLRYDKSCSEDVCIACKYADNGTPSLVSLFLEDVYRFGETRPDVSLAEEVHAKDLFMVYAIAKAMKHHFPAGDIGANNAIRFMHDAANEFTRFVDDHCSQWSLDGFSGFHVNVDTEEYDS